MSVMDAFFRLFSTAGAELLHLHGQSPSVPGLGVELRSTKTVSLSGSDLAPRHLATGFVVSLPAQTVVRVKPAADGNDGLWVSPIDSQLIALVPESSRKSAAADGYVLEIPPALVRTHFETVTRSK